MRWRARGNRRTQGSIQRSGTLARRLVDRITVPDRAPRSALHAQHVLPSAFPNNRRALSRQGVTDTAGARKSKGTSSTLCIARWICCRAAGSPYRAGCPAKNAGLERAVEIRELEHACPLVRASQSSSRMRPSVSVPVLSVHSTSMRTDPARRTDVDDHLFIRHAQAPRSSVTNHLGSSRA